TCYHVLLGRESRVSIAQSNEHANSQHEKIPMGFDVMDQMGHSLAFIPFFRIEDHIIYLLWMYSGPAARRRKPGLPPGSGNAARYCLRSEAASWMAPRKQCRFVSDRSKANSGWP